MNLTEVLQELPKLSERDRLTLREAQEDLANANQGVDPTLPAGVTTMPDPEDAADERLRARQATAVVHWPVATAMAACPTAPQPAPPPYPTCEKNVMSPSPTARATSTSRLGSSVYDASPSTSDGAMPASSSARAIAWQASESSVSARPLPRAVWPIPTTAVRFLIPGITSPSTPVRGAPGTR